MSDTIDITGIDKAELLAALYNDSRPLGMGYLHFNPADMSIEEARALLSDSAPTSDIGLPRKRLDFDYLKGRVIKVDLSGDTIRSWGYDRDNGQGATERIVARLRAEVRS